MKSRGGCWHQECSRPVEVEVCAWLAKPSCCKGDGTGWADIPCGTGGHIHYYDAAGDVTSCGIERHRTAFLLCTVYVSTGQETWALCLHCIHAAMATHWQHTVNLPMVVPDHSLQMLHPAVHNPCQHKAGRCSDAVS